MGIQHKENVPASFADAFADNYLGNPEVVSGLVGQFCANIEHFMNGGTASKDDFIAKSHAMIREYADIFSGRSEAYKPMVGYNTITLPAKLIADLGPFWAEHRGKWNDDSVCVFFEWLFVTVAEQVKRADGDDFLLEVMLRPTVQQVVKILLGVERRAMS